MKIDSIKRVVSDFWNKVYNWLWKKARIQPMWIALAYNSQIIYRLLPYTQICCVDIWAIFSKSRILWGERTILNWNLEHLINENRNNPGYFNCICIVLIAPYNPSTLNTSYTFLPYLYDFRCSKLLNRTND